MPEWCSTGLPIGFSRNDDYIGLTCAACHTQQIKYNNKFIRIDGGQSMMDLPAFRYAIETSMQATLNDNEKYKRFEERVLGENASQSSKEKLKKETGMKVNDNIFQYPSK